ncbi:MAG: tRNA lysidine(34) synthetase TilS [Candidatus Omnitrophica bacterium]|nr:tRNA lysidine(34) synthetase TilS [Candidatus Omnitrophota bacterium]
MIIDKAIRTIRHYNLICRNDRIVVGVSGGPDSVALLYILNSLKNKLKISLHVAHLDHMLRKDSCRDRVFVENLAKKIKLPITCASIDIKKTAKRGSVEEIARNARLNFLSMVAKDTKAQKIALGHNLDDQAETILMRLIRGSGLYGLSGILPKRRICGYQVIRPLIEIKRKEIEAFLRKKKIKPRIDISNARDIYFRNKIRNNLMPLLEKEYNRNIKEVLGNAAGSIACDYDFLNKIAADKIGASGNNLKLDRFLRFHPSIQHLVLRHHIARLKGDTRSIDFRHIKEIEDLVFNRPPYSIVDLPKNVSVVKKKKHISFYLRAKNQ